MVECIGIRYKGVMYPQDKPPAGFFDKLIVATREMLEKRQQENESFDLGNKQNNAA